MSNFNWSQISEEDLLNMKIKDLPLNLEESDVYPWVDGVLRELHIQLPHFHPHLFVGDEWFSPEGVAAVSIPFFLLHPRLRALEKKMMLECDGDEESYFRKLLRHELGHAFDHAFKISGRRVWEKHFGPHKKEYNPDTYRPQPYSRNFVVNLDRWYAQSHPDEDFAESFAICLDPQATWRSTYKKWGALKKVEYVDGLIKELAGKVFRQRKGRMISEARFLNSTLKKYYKKKMKAYEEEYPSFYDRDLLRIFSKRADEKKGAEKAFRFMKRNRKFLLASISHWTGEKKVNIEFLLSRLIDRCQELDLVLSKSEFETSFELAGLLTTLITHYLFTGHFRRTV